MKPKKIELDQVKDREAWLSWRRCHLTATDSAALMGLSRYKTAYDVYKDKLGLSPEKPINTAMQAGIDNEPVARKILSKHDEIDYQPMVFESGEHTFAGASLDAISPDWKKGGEIKCVGEKTFDRAINDDIDEEYIIQCQKQIYVADLQKWSLFFMLVSGPNLGATCKINIKRDEPFIKKMVKAEKDFWFNHILPQIPPPLTNRDFVQNDEPFENQQALQWAEMKAEYDSMGKSLKALEGQLKELAEGKSVHYTQARVKLTQVSRKGNIDWPEVCKVWKINEKELEKFRKEKSSYVKISSEV